MTLPGQHYRFESVSIQLQQLNSKNLSKDI